MNALPTSPREIYRGERILFGFRWILIFIGLIFLYKYRLGLPALPLAAVLLLCAFYNSLFAVLPEKIVTREHAILLGRLLDAAGVTAFVGATTPSSDAFLLYFLILIVGLRQLSPRFGMVLAVGILLFYWTPALFALPVREVQKTMALRSLYLFLGYVLCRLIEEPYLLTRPAIPDGNRPEGSRPPLPDGSPPASPIEPLSPREREVLSLLGEGKGTKEIARALVVSESTVKTHIANLQSKLGISDRIHLILFAAEQRKHVPPPGDSSSG